MMFYLCKLKVCVLFLGIVCEIINLFGANTGLIRKKISFAQVSQAEFADFLDE